MANRITRWIWTAFLLALMAHSAAYLYYYQSSLAGQGQPFGGDFSTFYRRAQMAAQGQGAQSIYDQAPLVAQMHGEEATVDTLPPYPYPPHSLPFLSPLGHMGYNAALAAWLGASALIYLAGVLFLPGIAHRLPLAAFALLSPFALYNWVTAQNGFFTAGLMLLGLSLLPRRPVLAGLCFGLLTLKPQLGLMLPVLLLARRDYKTIAAAILAALIPAGVATAWYGTEVWPVFAQYSRTFLAMLETLPGTLMGMNAGLYRALLLHGAPQSVALGLQGIAALFAAATLWQASRKGEYAIAAALAVTGTVLAAPHILTYDLCACLWPALMLFTAVWEGREGPYEALALAMLLLSPIMALMMPGVPAVFLAALLCHVCLWRRAIRRPS